MMNYLDYTEITLLSVFIASILGSAHCVGMCGGIVMLYSSTGGSSPKSHLSYNFGRLSSYLFLGALAGTLGKSLNLASTAAGIGEVASLVFGVLLLLWGAMIIVQKRSLEYAIPGSAFLKSAMKSLATDSSGTSPSIRAYMIGSLSTLLPCGWLYMFAAAAAASGSPLWGMLVMGSFWLGTFPYLFSVGLGSQVILGRLRAHLPLITGILIIFAGSMSIAQHLSAHGMVSVLSNKASHDMEACH